MKLPESDKLVRLILGCLLFRLGGEQTFTADRGAEEIDFICTDVRGIQLLLTTEEQQIAFEDPWREHGPGCCRERRDIVTDREYFQGLLETAKGLRYFYVTQGVLLMLIVLIAVWETLR